MKERNEIDQLFEESLSGFTAEPSVEAWDNIASGLDGAANEGSSSATSTGITQKYLLWALMGTVAAVLAYVFFFNQNQSSIYSVDSSVAQSEEKREVDVPTVIEGQGNNQISLSKETNSDLKSTKINKENDIESSSKPSVLSNKQETTKIDQLNNNNSKPLEVKESPIVSSVIEQDKSHSVDRYNSVYEVAIIENSNENLVVVYKPESQNENKQVKEAIIVSAALPLTEATLSESNLRTESVVKEQNELEVATEPSVENTEVSKVVGENLAKEEIVSETVSEAKEENIVEKENTVASESKSTATQESKPNEDASIPSPSETTGTHFATGWSVDIFGGPAWIMNNEQAISDEGQPISQVGIDNNIVTPSMGLNLKYHVNNWFIQSGVAYAEYGENKNYNQKIEMHDTSGYAHQNVDEYYTYDSVGFYIDPNNPGVVITLYDAIKHYDTSYNWVSEDSIFHENQGIYAQNRFRYIEIPLMLGYEFRFKNLSVEVSTGVSFGFRVNSSGKFLNSKNELIDINQSNSPYSNTMMNYLLSVGLKYHLDNRFSIIAQPIYKTNLNSLFSSESSPSYNHFGLNIGLNYIIK
ncbi:MAG: hypothetical protein DRI84_02980 [Bacteroidetes bacterium]|nr:MAG: hypothetical protein DRI84_02980 [Bacteroidota bacterium]